MRLIVRITAQSKKIVPAGIAFVRLSWRIRKWQINAVSIIPAIHNVLGNKSIGFQIATIIRIAVSTFTGPTV